MEHYFLDLSIPQILALSQNLSLYTADQIILDYVITQQVTTPEQVVTYLNERGYSQYSVEDVKSTFQDFKITQQADGTYKPDTTKTPLSETHIQEAKWRLANKKMQSLADFVYVESLRHTLDGQKLKGGGKYTVNFDYPKLTQHFATLGLNIDQDVIIRSCNQHEFQFSDKTIWKPKAYYSYKLFKLISTNSYAPIKDAATLTLAISIIEDHASVESLAKAVSERYGQNVSVETTKQLLIQLEIIKTNGGNYKPIFLAKHSLSRMDKSHIRFWLSNEKLVSVQQFIINETKRVLGLGKDIDILAIREQLTSYGVNIDTDTINTTVKENIPHAVKNSSPPRPNKQIVLDYIEQHKCRYISEVLQGLAEKNIYVGKMGVLSILKNSDFAVDGDYFRKVAYAHSGFAFPQAWFDARDWANRGLLYDSEHGSLLGEWLKQVDFKAHVKNFAVDVTKMGSKIFYNHTLAALHLAEYIIVWGKYLETGKLDDKRLVNATLLLVGMNPHAYSGLATLASEGLMKSSLEGMSRLLKLAFSEGIVALFLLDMTVSYRDELKEALAIIKKKTGATLGEGMVGTLAQWGITAVGETLYAAGEMYKPLTSLIHRMITKSLQALLPQGDTSIEDLANEMPIVLQETSHGLVFDRVTLEEIEAAQQDLRAIEEEIHLLPAKQSKEDIYQYAESYVTALTSLNQERVVRANVLQQL